MKHLVLPVIAASFVSIAFNLGLQLTRDKDPPDFSAHKVNELTAAVDINVSSIASLRSELGEVRDHLTGICGQMTGQAHAIAEAEINNLLKRVESIEDSVDTLSDARPGGSLPGKNGGDGLATFLAKNSPSAAENTAVFESDFEADSGEPLGNFSDSIDEALHSIEGIEVTGVDCRTSVCKVSYSKPERTDSQEEFDSEDELVNRLAVSAPGRGVEVRYDKDAYGEDIMYIMLR